VPEHRVRGRLYDEWEPGQVLETPGRTITEADLVLFAGLSGDYHPLHTDAEYAAGTEFGGRVAHGLLGLAVCFGLLSRLGLFEESLIAHLGVQDWRFLAPVRPGDTVHARATVAEKRLTARPGRGLVVFDVELLNQHGQPVQRGRHVLLFRAGGPM
jgi:acyl dehydratase